MKVAKQVGINIRRLRKQLGLSQERLANQLEMSPAYFRKIEHGAANPTLGILEKIAESLDTTVSLLSSEVEGIPKH